MTRVSLGQRRSEWPIARYHDCGGALFLATESLLAT